jgi:hypothetical protein
MIKPCLAVVLGFAVLIAAADVTGTWEIEFTFDDHSSDGGFDCVFTQQGEQLAGNCSGGTVSVTGEVKGQNVSWHLGGEARDTPTFTGTVDAGRTNMTGRFVIAGKGGAFSGVKR